MFLQSFLLLFCKIRRAPIINNLEITERITTNLKKINNVATFSRSVATWLAELSKELRFAASVISSTCCDANRCFNFSVCFEWKSNLPHDIWSKIYQIKNNKNSVITLKRYFRVITESRCSVNSFHFSVNP